MIASFLHRYITTPLLIPSDMKKLKLQMQLSADGFVCGPEGQLDWMTWTWDVRLQDFVRELTGTVDTIVMGRKMADGFMRHWEAAANNADDPSKPFADLMVGYPKIIFSQTNQSVSGINASMATQPLVETIQDLKQKEGKDIIVYGGAGFVSSLIENNLIDELNLFINPTAIGEGMRIFKRKVPLELDNSTRYGCGIVVNKYVPVN
jgi:dihydrofolate reductase